MNYTEKIHNIKNFDECSGTPEQIQEYTEKVRKGLVKCDLPNCVDCDTEAEFFKRHEARQRQFYSIVDDMVKITLGLLIRWKCVGCGKTFTGYPYFAVPYKRYTLPTIKKYSGLYTEDHQASYRKVILKNIIGYPGSEQQFSHSSIYRWITSLGNYSNIIRNAQDLYLQAKPESSISRELALLTIPSKKYQTEERQSILQRCRQLLRLDEKYSALFNVSIFPNIGTKCSFC